MAGSGALNGASLNTLPLNERAKSGAVIALSCAFSSGFSAKGNALRAYAAKTLPNLSGMRIAVPAQLRKIRSANIISNISWLSAAYGASAQPVSAYAVFNITASGHRNARHSPQAQGNLQFGADAYCSQIGGIRAEGALSFAIEARFPRVIRVRTSLRLNYGAEFNAQTAKLSQSFSEIQLSARAQGKAAILLSAQAQEKISEKAALLRAKPETSLLSIAVARNFSNANKIKQLKSSASVSIVSGLLLRKRQQLLSESDFRFDMNPALTVRLNLRAADALNFSAAPYLTLRNSLRAQEKLQIAFARAHLMNWPLKDWTAPRVMTIPHESRHMQLQKGLAHKDGSGRQ